ncbi:MAG: glycosyltransferase family 39 protein [Bacteroidetes bacterium]|jgi:hypothetical protein|nr:glycosyltransferase family 39 protein [Bacteroidota bacterium]
MKNNNKHIYLFIVVVAIIKIFFSFFIELGNDESYYYTYALQPQLNYFDHPPMVGFLIRLTTLNLAFVNDVTLRLGAIISCAIASVFIYKIASLFSNETAGKYAVLLYNFSIYTGVIAGFFIMPDSLQMPFWCAALWVMCCLIFQQKEKQIFTWLLLGLVIGIAILCKIHSLYLWAGFGMYIIFYKTKWLLNWRLYVSFLVTLICCLPILIWNIQNDFITYKFHSKRVTHTSINLDSFFQELIGEALYQNPIVYIIVILGVVKIIQNSKFKIQSKFLFPNSQFLILLSIPMILLFWMLSLFNDIFPHWSGPGFIPLFIISAIVISKSKNKIFHSMPAIAGILLIIVFATVTFLIHFYPSNFGSKNKENFGESCPTLDISGWENMSNEFYILYKNDIKNNDIKNPVLLINKWFPACQLQLYTSTKTKIPVVAIGNLEDVHQFAWLNKQQPQLQLGNDAYCIVPSNQPINVANSYGKYFATIEQPQVIEQYRSNKVVRQFYVFRLKNCIQIPPPILP